MQKHTSDFTCYNPVFFIVDEKAMIRNRYNQIPHPSPDTIRERNINKSRRHKKITAQSESQEISSFSVDVHEATLNVITNSQRLTESGRTNTIRINHNRSTALEPSVINYRGLKPVSRCLDSAVLHIYISCPVRLKDFYSSVNQYSTM